MLLGDYLLAKLWRELFYLSTRNTAAEKREMGVLEEKYLHPFYHDLLPNPFICVVSTVLDVFVRQISCQPAMSVMYCSMIGRQDDKWNGHDKYSRIRAVITAKYT